MTLPDLRKKSVCAYSCTFTLHAIMQWHRNYHLAQEYSRGQDLACIVVLSVLNSVQSSISCMPTAIDHQLADDVRLAVHAVHAVHGLQR